MANEVLLCSAFDGGADDQVDESISAAVLECEASTAGIFLFFAVIGGRCGDCFISGVCDTVATPVVLTAGLECDLANTDHGRGGAGESFFGFGGVIVVRDAIHETADGRRFLVVHGDEFDGIVQHARWLAFLGDWSYRTLLMLNTLVARMRHRMGLGYWSFSAYLKVKVKNALQFIENFEKAVTDEARRRGVDGVICGHIHKAEMRDMDGILYVNDGDWVESCTALVEHHDGRLEIIEWAGRRSSSNAPRNLPAVLPEPVAA